MKYINDNLSVWTIVKDQLNWYAAIIVIAVLIILVGIVFKLCGDDLFNALGELLIFFGIAIVFMVASAIYTHESDYNSTVRNVKAISEYTLDDDEATIYYTLDNGVTDIMTVPIKYRESVTEPTFDCFTKVVYVQYEMRDENETNRANE